MTSEIAKDLFEEAFPGVTTETIGKFRSFLASDRMDYKWLFSEPLPHLSQGDIILSIPAFYLYGTDIKKTKQNYPAILLEHTCDMVFDDNGLRNANYVLAPLFPFDEIARNIQTDDNALMKNIISNKIYMGVVPGLEKRFVVDLDLVVNVASEWLHLALKSGEISRPASLSPNGYYFLLAKLSIHFLRSDKRQ